MAFSKSPWVNAARLGSGRHNQYAGRMLRKAAQFLLLLAVCAAAPARAAELRVTFFDVGQGDAALVQAPSGKTVLIDAGPPEAASSLRARLDALLSAPIDLVVLTHAHQDHFGGMQEALGVRGARLFMDSGFEHPSPSYDALIKYVDRRSIRRVNASSGHSFDLGGGARLDVLAPNAPFISGTASDSGANSIVVKLVYGKRSFLFAGDIEAETEAALLAKKLDLRADVLKVAHHGARGSSTPAFLDAVQPSVAIISSGPGNPIGAPSRAVSDRLLALHARVLRTDLDGEVRISTDGDSLHVETGTPRAGTASTDRREHVRGQQRIAQRSTSAISVERISDDPQLASAHVSPTVAPSRAGPYVASQRSDVFHKADCRYARRIKPENRVGFATRKEALDSGRRPASCCHP